MNRNEAIEFLKRNEWGAEVEGWSLDETAVYYWNGVHPVITRSEVFGTESLQSRIETLLDMKFDTESTLLAAIGSLWGDNYRREVQELAAPHRIDSDAGPLDTLKRLVHKQASDLHNVATLLLERGVMNNGDTVLPALKQLIEQGEELTQIKGFASHYSHLGRESVTQVIARLAKSAQRPMKPVKTYWDGAEPIRVGHIVEQGVVEVPSGTKSCIRNHSDELVLVRTSNLKPHPFAKYTEQEREFLQAQIEAGVIKLC